MKMYRLRIAKYSLALGLGAGAWFTMANGVPVDPEFPHFKPDRHVVTSVAAVELSTARADHAMLENGQVSYFRPWSNISNGAGDVIKFLVDTNNNPITSVNLDVPDIDNARYVPDGGDQTTWSANQVMMDKLQSDPTWWDNSSGANKRRVFTRIQQVDVSDYGQVAFTYNNLQGLKSADVGGNGSIIITDMFSQELVRYIRGDRTTEKALGGSFDNRISLLGPVINGNLVYVNSNQGNGYGLASYTASGHVRPSDLLVVPSQDGMVHVFDALSGEEKYAYLPSMGLYRLSRATTGEEFYGVDGKVSVADAPGPNGWSTYALGGMGRGGKGFYILELTDSPSEDGNHILYERRGTNSRLIDAAQNPIADSDSEDADMGMIFEQAAVYRFKDGNVYAVFGNGYNSESRNSVLYMYRFNDGATFKTPISVFAGDPLEDAGSGLGMPALWDDNGDDIVDYGYVGDIDGNIWRLDFTVDPKAPTFTKLYSGNPNQPILQRLVLSDYGDDVIVYGVTGRMFSEEDFDEYNGLTQRIVAVRDDFSANLSMDITSSTMVGFNTIVSGDSMTLSPKQANRTIKFRVEPGQQADYGFFVDMPGGMTMVHPIGLRQGRLRIPVTKMERNTYDAVDPDDDALEVRESWDCHVDFLTAVLSDPAFDDGEDDKINGDYAVCRRLGRVEDGTLLRSSERIMYRNDQRQDYIFLNGAVYLPYTPPDAPPPPPTGDPLPPGNLLGGHIDLDTNYAPGPRWDGDGVEKAATHDHAYDVMTCSSMFDIRNMKNPMQYADIKDDCEATAAELGGEAGKVGKGAKVDSFATDNGSIDRTLSATTKFFLTVSNADINPSAMLVLSDRCRISVAEYQVAIQKALEVGVPTFLPDASTNPADSCNGQSMLFTIQQIESSGVPFSVVWPRDGLMNGGVIPSEPGDHKDGEFTNNRPRAGALYFQLIHESAFSWNNFNANLGSDPTDFVWNVSVTYPGQTPTIVHFKDPVAGKSYRGVNYRGNKAEDMMMAIWVYWHAKTCDGVKSYTDDDDYWKVGGDYQECVKRYSPYVRSQCTSALYSALSAANEPDIVAQMATNQSFPAMVQIARDATCTSAGCQAAKDIVNNASNAPGLSGNAGGVGCGDVADNEINFNQFDPGDVSDVIPPNGTGGSGGGGGVIGSDLTELVGGSPVPIDNSTGGGSGIIPPQCIVCGQISFTKPTVQRRMMQSGATRPNQ